MKKLSKATGGKPVINIEGLLKSDLGFAEVVEERKIGDDKMTFIEGSKNPHSVTILIRGVDKRFIDEAERHFTMLYASSEMLFRRPRLLLEGELQKWRLL